MITCYKSAVAVTGEPLDILAELGVVLRAIDRNSREQGLSPKESREQLRRVFDVALPNLTESNPETRYMEETYDRT